MLKHPQLRYGHFINDEFVESGAFESTVLKDGDVVEFLYFMEADSNGVYRRTA